MQFSAAVSSPLPGSACAQEEGEKEEEEGKEEGEEEKGKEGEEGEEEKRSLAAQTFPSDCRVLFVYLCIYLFVYRSSLTV